MRGGDGGGPSRLPPNLATINFNSEPMFCVAAMAVQLALRCAMEDGAAPLRGSYLDATDLLNEWQHVETAAALRGAAMQRSESIRTMRVLLAEGGTALTFLCVTAAMRPETLVPPPRIVPAKLRQRCDAPGCAEAEAMTGQFKKCARCQDRWYCSKACQVAHLTAGHKRECAAAAAASAASAGRTDAS
jgi:hypothetical protein